MNLAFMGISGAGKDYLAHHLTSNYNYVRFSFSDQLKRLSHAIYPWMKLDYEALEKGQPLNIRLSTGELIDKSPREIWLHLDALRLIESKIFIRMLDEQLDGFSSRPTPRRFLTDRIIITDIRTTDELMWCKERGFIVIHIIPSKKIYANFSIDKDINTNKNLADFVFVNNFEGTSSFEEFYRTRIAL